MAQTLKSYNQKPQTMKNVITLFIIMLGLSISASANNTNPVTPVKGESEIIFENVDVQYLVESADEAVEIVSATYNQTNDYFNITTKKIIQFVQILDENGELEYQLPIGAKKLNIAMPDFTKGKHKINLLLEGGDIFVATELVKKF